MSPAPSRQVQPRFPRRAVTVWRAQRFARPRATALRSHRSFRPWAAPARMERSVRRKASAPAPRPPAVGSPEAVRPAASQSSAVCVVNGALRSVRPPHLVEVRVPLWVGLGRGAETATLRVIGISSARHDGGALSGVCGVPATVGLGTFDFGQSGWPHASRSDEPVGLVTVDLRPATAPCAWGYAL
jgi:hypothetical protein